MFAVSDQHELGPDEDLVNTYLCRLQDGLKVTTTEATEALKQYRKFQEEVGRLQNELARPSRTPKMSSSLYLQEKSYKQRTDKIIASKEKEIVNLKQKLAETTARLAALVGTQVVEVDDSKSDLTDTLKPTELAEDFRSVFNNEWNTAYEELKVAFDEAKVLIYLGKVAWRAFEFAEEMAQQQLEELMKKEIEIIRIMSRPSFQELERRQPIVSQGIAPRKFERDETLQLLKDYRRCLARTSVKGVKQIFITLISRTPPTDGGSLTDGVKNYLRRVVELSYLMSIQDPPMHLEWVRFGDVLDQEKFKPYSRDGNKIVGTIWPVVLLHKDGPVMSRGIVDVIYYNVKPQKPAVKKTHC